jgi:cation diffusion facilitator CzcD-associated flavoprotein CzcO
MEFLYTAMQKSNWLLRDTVQKVMHLILRQAVSNVELRRKLTPNYPIGCKRLLVTDDWYPTLQRPNVNLNTDSIVRFTETGIVTRNPETQQETTVPLDILLLGTGFKATEFLYGMDFYGIDGISLKKETWKHSAKAYRGYAVSGFPNLFMLYGPNTNLGHSR